MYVCSVPFHSEDVEDTTVRREAKLLLQKACDSLLLGVELFNRPSDTGRTSGTLIFIDHSFEMLLKSAIVHRGGQIRERRSSNTIGFDACVRKAQSDSNLSFLTKEQAIILRALNSLRDAEQHYMQAISEGQLYFHVQSGFTLFRDILFDVFAKRLTNFLPHRVLPISTEPPTDLLTLFDSEIDSIRVLLQPGRRRHQEAMARLRPLAILNSAIEDNTIQPSDSELSGVGKALLTEGAWEEVFQGVATLSIVTDGSGPELSIRVSKKDGIPVRLVPEGTLGAAIIATRRVNELGFYNLNATKLAKRLGLTMPKTIAAVEYCDLRSDENCYKEFEVGKTVHKLYSQNAIPILSAAVEDYGIDEIWKCYRRGKKAAR